MNLKFVAVARASPVARNLGGQPTAESPECRAARVKASTATGSAGQSLGCLPGPAQPGGPAFPSVLSPCGPLRSMRIFGRPIRSGDQRRRLFKESSPVHEVYREEIKKCKKIDELVEAIDPFNAPDMTYSSSFMQNSRGMSLFTYRFVPSRSVPIRGLIFFFVGFSGN